MVLSCSILKFAKDYRLMWPSSSLNAKVTKGRKVRNYRLSVILTGTLPRMLMYCLWMTYVILVKLCFKWLKSSWKRKWMRLKLACWSRGQIKSIYYLLPTVASCALHLSSVLDLITTNSGGNILVFTRKLMNDSLFHIHSSVTEESVLRIYFPFQYRNCNYK